MEADAAAQEEALPSRPGLFTKDSRVSPPAAPESASIQPSMQGREEPEDLAALPIHVDDGPAFGPRHAAHLGDGLRELLEPIDRVARVDVVIHRAEETVPRSLDQGRDFSGGPGAGRGPGGLDGRPHRIVLLPRPREAFRIVLDVFAVRGFQQTETDHFSGVVAEDLADRHEVPEALRHLLPLEGDEPVVHPGPGPLDAPGALADHRLALVVRELQVDAAAVDVERRSEILVRHRVALHMPAGATVTPTARPRLLVSRRPLPEGEIERILLRARGCPR